MANTLSTIFFIDDNPVGYEVRRQQDKMHFTPTLFTAKACCPPQFTVTADHGSFRIDTAMEEEMKTQVMHAIEELQIGKLLE